MRETCNINIALDMTAERPGWRDELGQQLPSADLGEQEVLPLTGDVDVVTDNRGAIHREKKANRDADDDVTSVNSASSKSSKTVTFVLPGSASQISNKNGTDGSDAASDTTVSDNTALRGLDMASLPMCADGGVDYTMRRPLSCVSAPALRTGWMHGLRTRGSMSYKRQVPGRYFPPLSSHNKRSDRIVRDGTPKLQPTCSGYAQMMRSSSVRGRCDSRVVLKSKAVSGRDWSRPRYNSAGVAGALPRYANRPYSSVTESLFSIKFRDPEESAYDPSSEMTSDYYTIEKLYLFPKRTTRTRLQSDIACLQGESKLLHVRQSRDV